MNTKYQKINTLFKRDNKNKVISNENPIEEHEYFKHVKSKRTEKIDGTNIRIQLIPEYDENNNFKGYFRSIQGRTDDSNIPSILINKLNTLFPFEILKNNFLKNLKDGESPIITLYGEGYGKKIQKGGGYIQNDVNFILFDVKIGKWWLTREAIELTAKDLNIKAVPLIGYFTINEAIEYVKKGFKSTISEDKNLDAEGLVLKTPNGLLFRNGERIITKLKTVDFIKYKNKYE